MFTSIFSPFDVFCAESIGQKVSASNTRILQKSSAKIDDRKSVVEANPSPQVPKKPEVARRPRFAPEFDGVHCFETILPY